MIKRVMFVLALITAFILGYLCGLLRAYEEVKVGYEIMVYEPEPEIMVAQEKVVEEKVEEVSVEEKVEDVVFLGEFKVTAYCPCYECSEEYGRQTSTGATATEGRTIAVDPRVIPYGSEVVIDGHTYRAEDCGGLIKGNKVDIFFDSHNDVDAYGLQKHDIFLKCEV